MNDDFLKELNISALIKIKENTWNGKDYLDIRKFITNDITIISYRLDALGDLVENPNLLDLLRELMPDISAIQEYRSLGGMANDNIENLYAVQNLKNYIELTDSLYEILNKYELKSEMFLTLRDQINAICLSDEFIKIKEYMPKSTDLLANLQSVTIGVNMDSSFHPIEAGLVSINSEKYVSGGIIDKILRMDFSENSYNCLSPLTLPGKLLTVQEKNELQQSLNTALHKVLSASLKSWKPAIHTYNNSKVTFILKYYSDLRFLIASAELFISLKKKGYPVCRPKVHPQESKICILKEIYSPETVLYSEHMICNDFETDLNGMFYVLSGANAGGKTMFIKSVAVCLALFHLGLYVPAEYAELSPCSEILLHFPEKEKQNISRFTDECIRMSKLMKLADEYSFILCDESLSGTNSIEAASILSEILKAVSAKGARGIMITHIHELSKIPKEINALPFCKSKLDNLTVETDKEGKRMYKICRSSSDGKSYASDIAKKYGLSFDDIMNPS